MAARFLVPLRYLVTRGTYQEHETGQVPPPFGPAAAIGSAPLRAVPAQGCISSCAARRHVRTQSRPRYRGLRAVPKLPPSDAAVAKAVRQVQSQMRGAARPMTLRLVRDAGSRENHWLANCGAINFGSVQPHPGIHLDGVWTWTICRINEPGWHFGGSADSRDEAMLALGACFRRWLDFGGLKEFDDFLPQGGPPFKIERNEVERQRVLTPAGLHVGFVEPFLTTPGLISAPREKLFAAWQTKFIDRFIPTGCGTTAEAAVAHLASSFRAYLAKAGIREA